MDPRLSLLKAIERKLYDVLDPEEAEEITEAVTVILGDYEISDRCTDVAIRDTTNDKIIKTYRACLLVEGKSENTVYQYGRCIQRLSEFLGKPFPEVGTYDVRYFLASEKQRGISERSVENTRSYLSAFFTWMYTEEMISKNPMAAIKPITYDEEIRREFSDVEIDRLKSACQTKRERAIIETLLATGVRVSELSEMKVGDIDYKALEVTVEHGKGGHKRTTYITPVAVAHLEAYFNERPEKEGVYLLYNKNHDKLEAGGIRHSLKQIGKRAGVTNVHPHRFRRTFATRLAARGMDVREIQVLLGHRNLNTTMVYINNDKESVKASYRKHVS